MSELKNAEPVYMCSICERTGIEGNCYPARELRVFKGELVCCNCFDCAIDDLEDNGLKDVEKFDDLEQFVPRLESENAELRKQINAMKCCGNCGYDRRESRCTHPKCCAFNADDFYSGCDNWKLRGEK